MYTNLSLHKTEFKKKKRKKRNFPEGINNLDQSPGQHLEDSGGICVPTAILTFQKAFLTRLSMSAMGGEIHHTPQPGLLFKPLHGQPKATQGLNPLMREVAH